MESMGLKDCSREDSVWEEIAGGTVNLESTEGGDPMWAADDWEGNDRG